MKKVYSITLIGILLATFWILPSCYKTNENGFPSLNTSTNTKESLKQTKVSSIPPEVFELLKIRDAIAYRVVKNKISQADLAKAYQNQDTKTIQRLLGINKNELEIYQERIKQLRESLLKKYPELKEEYLKQLNCKSCKETDIKAVYKKITSTGFFNIINGEPTSIMTPPTPNTNSIIKENGDGTCNWIPYTACLVVCTSTGPLFYWPCAYVCMCSFCTSIPGCDI